MRLSKLGCVGSVFAAVVVLGVASSPASALSGEESAAAGSVLAWGASYPSGHSPLDVPEALAGKTVTHLSTSGYYSALAATTDGEVHAWGSNNGGQATVPAELRGAQIDQLAAGGMGFNTAIVNGGTLALWGDRIGAGAAYVPDEVKSSVVEKVAPGYTHVAAVTAAGKVHVWGSFTDSVNDCDAGADAVPEALENEFVIDVVAGNCYTIATTRDGDVVGWPATRLAVAGIPTDLDGTTIEKLEGGTQHVTALLSAPNDQGKKIISWGLPDRTAVPDEVQNLDIVDISTGDMHTVYLTADGGAGGWGLNNGHGELNFPADKKWSIIQAGYNWTMGYATPQA